MPSVKIPSYRLDICGLAQRISQAGAEESGALVWPQEFTMQLSAVLTPAKEGGYIAHDPETLTTSDDETIEEALANLKEAVELYLEEFPSAG